MMDIVEDEPTLEPSIEDTQEPNEPVDEPETTGESEEGEVEEPETPPQEPVVQSKPLYTPEELDYLMASDMAIDTTRLSPEGQATVKQFQRAYTKKFQALAEEKRKFKETTLPVQSSDPFEQTYSRYRSNPRQVRQEINTKIAEIDRSDPYSDENRELIRGLQNLKEDLNDRYHGDIERNQKINKVVNETSIEVNKAIPDFEQKAPELTTFGQELGFSIDEIEFLTDPSRTGKMAAKFTIALNKAYDKLNIGAAADKKIKKPTPPQLVKSGVGNIGQAKKNPEDMTTAEYRAWRMKGGG